MTGDPFVGNRSLLFTVGYEMLGSAADAEDVVQETWLRWAGVDQAQVSDDRVAMFLLHAAKVPDFAATLAWINAMPGTRIHVAGAPGALSLVTEAGLVTRIYAIRNPEKLRWLEKQAELRH